MLSHLQDKWLPQGKSLLDSLLHPKFLDAAQAPPQEEPETVVLATHDELQQGETEEMGFQEQVQASEAREGDGFASAVALVRALLRQPAYRRAQLRQSGVGCCRSPQSPAENTEYEPAGLIRCFSW